MFVTVLTASLGPDEASHPPHPRRAGAELIVPGQSGDPGSDGPAGSGPGLPTPWRHGRAVAYGRALVRARGKVSQR